MVWDSHRRRTARKSRSSTSLGYPSAPRYRPFSRMRLTMCLFHWGGVLVVAEPKALHFTGNPAVGLSPQISGENLPHRAAFLRVADDLTVLDHVAERCLSLPRHLSHRPFHGFRQDQAVAELDVQLLRRLDREPVDEGLEELLIHFLQMLWAVCQVIQHLLRGLDLLVLTSGIHGAAAQFPQIPQLPADLVRLG